MEFPEFFSNGYCRNDKQRYLQVKIPFNKPYMAGKELEYIAQAYSSNHLSGDGQFTKKCQSFFEERYGFKKALLTTSCTDALEMSAILIDTQPGDEVIIPSYTFVSTANPFVLRGAKIVFADSGPETPDIDPSRLESLITSKTRAIVPVHYAGVSCDMDEIIRIAKKHNLYVVEDAAHAVDSYYKGRPLGSLGHLSAFSFHETKNITSGEGGMLAINDGRLLERAETIREKGTNRSAFFRGEVDKYSWVDIGSSFLPSDIIAAILYAQLEHLDIIQHKRRHIWDSYYRRLLPLAKNGLVRLPHIPEYSTNNGHMFYLVCNSFEERDHLLKFLNKNGVNAVFHYLCLHNSPYYRDRHDGRELPQAEGYEKRVLRLPFYNEMSEDDIRVAAEMVSKAYQS